MTQKSGKKKLGVLLAMLMLSSAVQAVKPAEPDKDYPSAKKSLKEMQEDFLKLRFGKFEEASV